MTQKAQILRLLVEQRLTAAAEEIFGLFERTIEEYEEELCRTKEENQRQREMLDSVWNPRVLIHKTDIQQLSMVKEEVPPGQQEWNPIVDQEEPEPLHIKEEQKELWTSQELNITKFSSTPVCAKSEDDDVEKVKSSVHNQTQTEENKVEPNKVDSGRQMETETDGDDDGGSEPDINLVHMENIKRRTFDSESLLEEHVDTHTRQKLDGSSEYEAFSQKKNTTHETSSPRDIMMNNDMTLSSVGHKKKQHHCSVCSKTFSQNSHLQWHMKIHTREKPFSCSLCGSKFTQKSALQKHMMFHRDDKPITCPLCNKCFRDKNDARRHMTVHTRKEKQFKCPRCPKCFTNRREVGRHMRIHTGEGFDCSLCGKTFTTKSKLSCHMRVHTGEKPFLCSLCDKRFGSNSTLQIHILSHTGEKPFACPLCHKCFANNNKVKRHMMLHTGERPFGCQVCQKRFSRKDHFDSHMKTHKRIDRMSHSLESEQQRLKNRKNNDSGKF